MERIGRQVGCRPMAPTALPSGVVTFLLTDAPDDDTLGAIVNGNDGVVLDDERAAPASLSVFSRATSAITAAMELADALAPATRIAVHVGEASERYGDYGGPAVERVLRLLTIAAA